jgi:outer membrane protein TolC
LPTEAPIVLDEKELEVLRNKGDKGLPLPGVSVEDAVEHALANRLDIVTSQDALQDSERAVAIARDALRAGLDITVSSSAQTEAPAKAVKFQFDEGTYSAGLTADLPIDRKQERNAYRQTLIALESQKRSFSLLRDNVKLEVRQAYRNLEQTKLSFEIQKKSVELARTRVDNAQIEQEVGRATTRDVLLAKDSLLRAQNDLTSALVNYEIAKLRLRLSTEELAVDERGLWVEEEITERGDENAESAKRTEGKKEELPKS